MDIYYTQHLFGAKFVAPYFTAVLKSNTSQQLQRVNNVTACHMGTYKLNTLGISEHTYST